MQRQCRGEVEVSGVKDSCTLCLRVSSCRLLRLVWDAAQDKHGSPCMLDQAKGECTANGESKEGAIAPCSVRVRTKAVNTGCATCKQTFHGHSQDDAARAFGKDEEVKTVDIVVSACSHPLGRDAAA